MARRTLLILSLAVAAGCADDADGTADTGSEPGEEEAQAVTLDNCPADVADNAPDFFTDYFACADISAAAGGTRLATDGLPPHPSPYYAEDDPNWVEFDDRGGTHMQNRNVVGAGDFEFIIPDAPVAKGITIDASVVDNQMGTSGDEYTGGAVGIALDGVVIFAAMAAPGDELAEEAFTFDTYEGHPAGSQYHYHFNTKGPLEVLEDRGLSSGSTPGEASVELYGIMCDGALVLGCTELDGRRPNDTDFDAQNGHVHDVGDGETLHFANRYHTHVCPSLWPDYPFFPEIAYYDTSVCPAPAPAE